MASILFVTANEARHDVAAEAGRSVMEIAVEAGIDGIDADCGGVCSCATCHVYVDPSWIGRVPVAQGDEVDLLDLVEERRDTSRLSCQIVFGDELDGLSVRIPRAQT